MLCQRLMVCCIVAASTVPPVLHLLGLHACACDLHCLFPEAVKQYNVLVSGCDSIEEREVRDGLDQAATQLRQLIHVMRTA